MEVLNLIIIDKKRIVFLFLTILLSISTYILVGNIKTRGEATEVSNLPVSNKVIIIDAGHGLPDRWCNTEIVEH